MRGDVLKTISSAKKVTNAIILTHNIDFVFVQTVVLAAFRRCGHPTLTIFADAGCAADSFAYQHPVLTGLGVRYRVVPVEMGPGFRFHPKAVFLSGEDSATLLVGSGNLTFGGWRENAEIWLEYESERDGTAPFHAFRSYLSEILSRVPLPDAVSAEVDEAFNPQSKSWAVAEPVGEAKLVGRVGAGSSLLNRTLDAIGGDPVDELIVCAPYFDENGIALQELITRTKANRSVVLCQPDRTTLTLQSWEPNASQATLQRVDFTRKNVAGDERSAFMHAKFYAFVRDQEVLVLAGSANCSRAALTTSGEVGNAELQGLRTLTLSEFEDEFLGELRLSSDDILLQALPAPDTIEEPAQPAGVRILAARYDARTLLVAYSPAGATVLECTVDEASRQFTRAEKGILHIPSAENPRVVSIRAQLDGVTIDSTPSWIDHERNLRATARSRSLADCIRTQMQPGALNASSWAEVMEVFCKHLSYMPIGQMNRRHSAGRDNGQESIEREFTAPDVFSDSYSAPKLSTILIPITSAGVSKTQSITQLLLRWLQVATDEAEEESEVPEGSENEDEGTENSFDQPEALPKSAPKERPQEHEVSERNRRRIETLLGHLEEVMTSSEFLQDRSPEYLAVDIKIASALLRLGLREGWVQRKRFFDLTHKIWSAMFFSSDPKSDIGWLEYRASKSEDSGSFVADMQSPELAAALLGWKLAAATDEAAPEVVRLELAAVLSAARLPWLWQANDTAKIAEELSVLLSHTAAPHEVLEDKIHEAEVEWALLLRRGQALAFMQRAIRSICLNELRHRIGDDQLNPGDLLWQGRAGFCVVTHASSRAAGEWVKVLKLQCGEGESTFDASSTIPLRALLAKEVVPYSHLFGEPPRQVIAVLLDQLKVRFTAKK